MRNCAAIRSRRGRGERGQALVEFGLVAVIFFLLVFGIFDMARLFEGIPLDKITTSMTVNCSASVMLAMYLVVAERQGVPWEKVGGTVQNDMLKEYIAQKEWICPPRPAIRVVTDMIEFCARKAPRWHAVSISGYHIREAGSTAVQELAFTIADSIAAVETVKTTYEPGRYDFLWSGGARVIALAAWLPYPARQRPVLLAGWKAVALPIACQVTAASIQVLALFRHLPESERVLTVLVLAIVAIAQLV